MALQDLLDIGSGHQKKIGISEERFNQIKPIVRQYLAFWREYPDLFVDFLVKGNAEEAASGSFKFYFYQRVFLRCCMRYQYVYAVFPRAYSKSFLSVLTLMLRCILFPGAHLFVTSGGKEQAASILHDKVNELCDLIPALKREIDWGRGKTQEGKDKVRYIFKNGSVLDNLAARESSRGQRRHGGLLEECVGIDDQILREVIIPVMAIDRRAEDGTTHAEESLNKSQIYVTTAGYKGTYPYDRLIGMLVRMITQPERCIVLGGTWRTPVAVGLQRKTFIKDQKQEGTYNEASFEREYESIWSGTAEDAFFDGNKFDINRIILQPEKEASGRISKLAYYVIGVDVGRKGCQTVATVIKVTPQSSNVSIKNIVNIYVFNEDHFEDQAIKLKQLFYKYKARRLVIDGNGLGAGLMDYMVKSQVDENNDTLPDFGVYGGTYDGADQEFKKFRTPITEQDAIYIIKANAPINTAIYSTMKSQLDSGRIKFLIDERVAKIKLLGTKRGQQMTPEQRGVYLQPFTTTSILKDEMMNLREEDEGLNIRLKPVNRTIGHDKVSSITYGIYYICSVEEERKRKKRFNASEWNFFN